MNSIGFDIGGTKVLSVVAIEDCLYDIKRIPTPSKLEELKEYICEMVRKYQKKISCDGIGIGIAGAWNKDGTLWVPNVPEVTGTRLDEWLFAEIGIPVYIENDAQAAIRGELWQGVLQGKTNAIMVSVGTGIGTGIVLDGNILRGIHGSAGAAGWLCMRDPGEGPFRFEELASGTALNELAVCHGFQSSRHLVQAVRAKQKIASGLWEQWITNLGTGIASMVSMLDVEVIVIAGGLVNEFDLYEQKLLNVIRKLVSPNNKSVCMYKSSLADKACLYGAAVLGQQMRSKKNDEEIMEV